MFQVLITKDTPAETTAMMKAVHEFFPLDDEGRVCGDKVEVMDVGGFMKMQTRRLWELSGIRG